MILPALAVSLLALVVIGYRLFDCDALCPFTLFAVGFAACAFMLLAFNYWDYRLGPDTALLVMLAVVVFLAAGLLVRHLAGEGGRPRRADALRVGPSAQNAARDPGFQPVRMSRAVFALVVVAQLVIVVASAYAIAKKYPAGSIGESIGAYGGAVKFQGKDGSLGRLLDNARLASVMWTYFACYVLAQEFAGKRYGNAAFAAFSVVMGMATQLETGGRQGAFTYALMVALLYLLVRRRMGNRLRVKAGVLMGGVAAVAVLAVVFRFSAIGREISGFDFMEYITVYCGAQLANLDIYLGSTAWFEPSTPGWMTFNGSLKWLAKHAGFPVPASDANATAFDLLPFQDVFDSSLGNVYSCLYNYLVDFGVAGVVVCVGVMAIVSQAIYAKLLRAPGKSFDLWAIVYAFAAIQLAMSFFSNKFYEEFLTLELLKGAVFFLLMRWAYLRIRVAPRSRGMLVMPKASAEWARDRTGTGAKLVWPNAR